MAKVVLVLVAFLAASLASCYEQCSVEDRRICWNEWEDCEDEAQACTEGYCDCLTELGCDTSCEWKTICLAEDDPGGG